MFIVLDRHDWLCGAQLEPCIRLSWKCFTEQYGLDYSGFSLHSLKRLRKNNYYKEREGRVIFLVRQEKEKSYGMGLRKSYEHMLK